MRVWYGCAQSLSFWRFIQICFMEPGKSVLNTRYQLQNAIYETSIPPLSPCYQSMHVEDWKERFICKEFNPGTFRIKTYIYVNDISFWLQTCMFWTENMGSRGGRLNCHTKLSQQVLISELIAWWEGQDDICLFFYYKASLLRVNNLSSIIKPSMLTKCPTRKFLRK